MAENLKYSVGWEDNGLQAGIERTIKQMKGLEKANQIVADQFQKGQRSLDSMTNALSKNSKRIDAYRRSLVNSSASVNGFSKNLNANAVPAMQEFSRIVQDAPYGIHGVANNIQQLTAQFQYLSVKSGGATKALKAMLGALAGPAGILLAVSALTAFGPQIIDFFKGMIRGSEQAKETVEDLNTALKENLSLQEKIAGRVSKALSDALKVRLNAAKREGKSLEEQWQIAKEFLEAEVANRQSSLKEIERLEERARQEALQAYEKWWKKKGDEQLKAERDSTREAFKAAQDASVKAREELNSALLLLDETYFDYVDQIRQRDQDNYEAGEKAKTKALKEELKRRKEAYDANPIFQQNLFDAGEFKGVPSFENALGKNLPQAIGFIEDSWTHAGSVFRNMQAELQEFGNQFEWTSQTINQGTLDAAKMAQEQMAALATAISNTMSNMFAGIGESIGDAISGAANGIEESGKRLLSSFGRFLGDLGKMAIAYGSFMMAMAIAQKQPPNPVSAGIIIAAGVAMVAIGKAIQNTMKMSGSAVSGGYTGSGGGSSNFSGSSASASSGAGGGRYVFEIEGTKLVGVLSNTLARNRALGGDLSLT